MSACPLGICDGSGEIARFVQYVGGEAIERDPCPCAAPAAITPPDPWALLALRRAEHDAAERIYDAARAERSRTWQARLDARIAADASGVPRST